MEELEKPHSLISLIFLFIVVTLLAIYWFVPFSTIELRTVGLKDKNSNFNILNKSTGMQFYEKMRYPSSEISYQIDDCPLQKRNDFEQAIKELSNKTILKFYQVDNDGEIKVTCDSKNKFKGGLFIAGEGGPTKIINTGNFNVIKEGKILLIRNSRCPRPNVALHELLHALGFKHSHNPMNIMYNISNCQQTLGKDIPLLINKLYSVKSLPDLVITNVSGIMRGKYLDINTSIKNQGLKNSAQSKLEILVDNKVVSTARINPLKIGEGVFISLSNLHLFKFNIGIIEVYINNSLSELDKKNNKRILKIGN